MLKHSLATLFLITLILTLGLIACEEKDDEEEGETDEQSMELSDASTLVLGNVEIKEGEEDLAASGAEVYVMGAPNTKVTTDEEGAYTLAIPNSVIDEANASLVEGNNGKNFITIISTATRSKGEFGVQSKVEVKKGDANEIESLYLKETGYIKGNIQLSGQVDHTGTLVYIPGTSYISITDKKGDFILLFIPEGTWPLRAEADGFKHVEMVDVEVVSKTTTEINPVALMPSTGIHGEVTIKKLDEADLSKTVMLHFSYSPEATVMKVSEDINFVDIDWEPVQENMEYTFKKSGFNSIYVTFADANGLESGPKQGSLWVGDYEPPIFAGLTGAQLVATAPGSKVTLSFHAISNQPEDPHGAFKYLVYGILMDGVGVDDACRSGDLLKEVESISFSAGSESTIEIEGLQNRGTYSFCLKVADEEGNISDTSVEKLITMQDDTPPNFAGLANVNVDYATHSINVNWLASSDPDLKHYLIKIKKGSGDYTELTTHKLQKNIAGSSFLEEGKSFFIKVDACDDTADKGFGNMNCTDTAATEMAITDLTPPAGFDGITVANHTSPLSEGSAIITWAAPPSWGDYRGFKVFHAHGNNSLELLKDCPCAALGCAEHLTSCTITNLDLYRTYVFHVRAYDNLGNLTTYLDPPNLFGYSFRTLDYTPPDLTELPTSTYIVNVNLQNQKTYFYTVCARDISHNETCPGNVVTRTVADIVPPTISSLTHDKGANDKSWNVTWGLSDNASSTPNIKLTIYRSFSSTAETPAEDPSNLVKFLEPADQLCTNGLCTLPNQSGVANQVVYVNYLLKALDEEGNETTSGTLSILSDNVLLVSTIYPDHNDLAGGRLISIYGLGFGSNATVIFKDYQNDVEVNCTDVKLISSKNLICTPPSFSTVQSWVLLVENSDGAESNADKVFSSVNCSNTPGLCDVCDTPASWDGGTETGGTYEFAGGDGSLSTPFQICSEDHLANIREYLNDNTVYFTLNGNVDLEPGEGDTTGWDPIGKNGSSGYDYPFKGHFLGSELDANDVPIYAIFNLTINRTNTEKYIGLFGKQADTSAEIKNLALRKVDIDGHGMVAAVVGWNNAGDINNVYVYAADIIGKGPDSGQRYTGGVTGFNQNGDIDGAMVEGSITSEDTSDDSSTGGIIGRAKDNNKSLKNLTFAGTVNGTGAQVGGIVGEAYDQHISDSQSSGSVIGSDNHVGGIVGYHQQGSGSMNSYLQNVTSSANVSGVKFVGGIAGQAQRAYIKNASSSGTITGTGDYVGGLVGKHQGIYAHETNKSSTLSSSATITGKHHVGGLFGSAEGGFYIEKSFFTGSINAGGAATNAIGGAGGLIGFFSCSGTCTIDQSYSTGNVLFDTNTGGNGFKFGGLVGLAQNTFNITNSYATGNVSANGKAGGFIGTLGSNSTRLIQNCYSTGEVTAGSDGGGLTGEIANATNLTIENSFWNTDTSNQSTTAGDEGTGKTTVQMVQKTTYTDANWDFITPLWTIDNGNAFPLLYFQNN